MRKIRSDNRAQLREKDREVVSVDSRVLITRFVDPDAAKRYGYMVYVRCTWPKPFAGL